MASERIVIDPAVCGGRPIMAGTRMRVSDVLDALVAGASWTSCSPTFPISAVRTCSPASPMARGAVDHSVVQAA